jgi:hypothetical protein
MNQKPTKIDLLGNPLVSGRATGMHGVLTRRDLKTFAFALAAGEMTLRILNPGVDLPLLSHVDAAGMVAASNIFGLALMRVGEIQTLCMAFRRTSIESTCIETKPDPKLPPNTGRWGASPTILKNYYKALLFGGALMAGYLLTRMGGMQVPVAIFMMASPYVVRSAEGLHRWRKVEQGKWRIEDYTRPPEPRRAPAKILVAAPARSPN